MRGRLLERGPTALTVEVGGVGLQLFVPERTASALPPPGKEVVLHTHLNVRETALELFGFATADERAMFQAFLGVSGVGPRTALAILSRLTLDEIVTALHGGDVDAFVRAPGVGKKTAQRVLLELSERFDIRREAGVPATGARMAAAQDAIQALITLGYTESAARKAVTHAHTLAGEGDLETSALIRSALAGLAGH